MVISLVIISLFLFYYAFIHKSLNIPFSINKNIIKYNFPKSIILSRKIFIIIIIFYSVIIWINFSFPFLLSYKQQDTIIETKNIHFLVDISKSMFDLPLSWEEQQIKKENKIKIVKEELLKTIDKFKGNKISLLTFSGKTIINVSPTFNIEKIKQGIQNILSDSQKVLSLPIYDDANFNWTAIGNSLLLSSTFFNKDEKNIAILLTDGENNTWIQIIDTINNLKEKGIKVYTLGLMDSNIDKKELKLLSKETNWQFIDNFQIKDISKIINNIINEENKPVIINRDISFYNYIEISCIILLLLLSFIELFFYIGRKNIFYSISYSIIFLLLTYHFYGTISQRKIDFTSDLKNNIDNINKIIDKENKNHLYFVIDFSKTMGVIENGSSRLDKTKFIIENIIKEISKNNIIEQKIGLIIFNIRSNVLLEGNWNKDFIFQYLKNLELDYAESVETDYNALIKSLKTIPNNSKIILFTDWSQYLLENEDKPDNISYKKYDSLKNILKEKEIELISILWIGEEKQSLIPIGNNSYKTMQGKKIYSYLDKKEIEELWKQFSANAIIYNKSIDPIIKNIKTTLRKNDNKEVNYFYYLLIMLFLIIQLKSEKLFK